VSTIAHQNKQQIMGKQKQQDLRFMFQNSPKKKKTTNTNVSIAVETEFPEIPSSPIESQLPSSTPEQCNNTTITQQTNTPVSPCTTTTIPSTNSSGSVVTQAITLQNAFVYKQKGRKTKKNNKKKQKNISPPSLPFQLTEEALQMMFQPLHFPEGMSEADKQVMRNMYQQENHQKQYFQSRHTMLTDEYVSAKYTKEALDVYLQETLATNCKNYTGNMENIEWNLDLVLPVSKEIFQKYEKKLKRRHQPTTIEEAEKKQIAYSGILRGVRKYVRNLSLNLFLKARRFKKSCQTIH
jgi:hypothetical protein